MKLFANRIIQFRLLLCNNFLSQTNSFTNCEHLTCLTSHTLNSSWLNIATRVCKNLHFWFVHMVKHLNQIDIWFWWHYGWHMHKNKETNAFSGLESILIHARGSCTSRAWATKEGSIPSKLLTTACSQKRCQLTVDLNIWLSSMGREIYLLVEWCEMLSKENSKRFSSEWLLAFLCFHIHLHYIITSDTIHKVRKGNYVKLEIRRRNFHKTCTLFILYLHIICKLYFSPLFVLWWIFLGIWFLSYIFIKVP